MDEDNIDQDDEPNEDDVDEDYLEKQEYEQYHNNKKIAEEYIDDSEDGKPFSHEVSILPK